MNLEEGSSVLPISEKSQMANSIADFVLQNPQYTDVIEAYNAWVQKERYRAFPWGKADTTVFCLDIFNSCINLMSRQLLQDVYFDEQRFLMET